MTDSKTNSTVLLFRIRCVISTGIWLAASKFLLESVFILDHSVIFPLDCMAMGSMSPKKPAKLIVKAFLRF